MSDIIILVGQVVILICCGFRFYLDKQEFARISDLERTVGVLRDRIGDLEEGVNGRSTLDCDGAPKRLSEIEFDKPPTDGSYTATMPQGEAVRVLQDHWRNTDIRNTIGWIR